MEWSVGDEVEVWLESRHMWVAGVVCEPRGDASWRVADTMSYEWSWSCIRTTEEMRRPGAIVEEMAQATPVEVEVVSKPEPPHDAAAVDALVADLGACADAGEFDALKGDVRDGE